MPTSDERILLTGAAGFIGSHVAERLLTSGASVIGVDNFDPFYPRREKERNIDVVASHPSFRLIEGDCADLAMLEGAVRDARITCIVHLAAKAGVRPSLVDPVGYVHANVTATQAVLELGRRLGIHRIVFGSSSSVYGDTDRVPFSEEMETGRPVSPYAATKRAAELLCSTHAHLHGASVIALRFFTVYGPRQRPDLAIRSFATRMFAGEPIRLHGDGSASRDYTWIDDIVVGVMAAIARTRTTAGRYDAINLGGSRTTTLTRLVSLLEDAIGTPALVDHLPPQPGDVRRTCADTTKAALLLGYRPRTPIEVGIPRFVSWLRQRQLPLDAPRGLGALTEAAGR